MRVFLYTHILYVRRTCMAVAQRAFKQNQLNHNRKPMFKLVRRHARKGPSATAKNPVNGNKPFGPATEKRKKNHPTIVVDPPCLCVHTVRYLVVPLSLLYMSSYVGPHGTLPLRVRLLSHHLTPIFYVLQHRQHTHTQSLCCIMLCIIYVEM